MYDLNESEADSDYEIKPHVVTGNRCSTEDLADDEREDTSEAEQEPEPDYDDEPTGKNGTSYYLNLKYNRQMQMVN